jgi:phytoene dehydrogenase-like protein
MTKMWDVIVIGGGLAGLTAAATARRAGASTLVLESAQSGGRARTTEHDGFVFNMGGHALYMGGEAAEVLGELGIVPVGSRPPLRTYKLLAGGELHTFPTSAESQVQTSALGTRGNASLAESLVRLHGMDPADHAAKSIEELIADIGVRSDAAAVLRALIRIGSFASDFDDLSADAALIQLQRGASKGVLYLDGGWRQLIDGLSRDLEIRRRTTVRQVRGDKRAVEVETADGVVVARTAIVATGTPASAQAVLPTDPDWGEVGDPLTAACLDVSLRGVPSPGYVLGVEDPLYGSTQSPPARQAPAGDSVVAVLRYGARSAVEDRPRMQEWLRLVGVEPGQIVTSRFLARMNVVGAIPRARNGGLAGRPAIDATAMPNVFLAGDWVGSMGCLSDASFASGYAAARMAVQAAERSAAMVPWPEPLTRATASTSRDHSSSASPTGWWARWSTPKTSFKRPGCVGTMPTRHRSNAPRRG